jgi:hypothetical protein
MRRRVASISASHCSRDTLGWSGSACSGSACAMAFGGETPPNASVAIRDPE